MPCFLHTRELFRWHIRGNRMQPASAKILISKDLIDGEPEALMLVCPTHRAQ